MSRRRLGFFIGAWVVMVLVCLSLVLYALEPLFVQQTQDQLLTLVLAPRSPTPPTRPAGSPASTVPTKAPEPGAPVAILEIGALHLRQVVVEGSTPAQTQKGPGHVVGSAGPGAAGQQRGAGPSRRCSAVRSPTCPRLQTGDEILVTTTQGQSVYRVDTVETEGHRADPSSATAANSSLAGLTATGGTGTADGRRTPPSTPRPCSVRPMTTGSPC